MIVLGWFLPNILKFHVGDDFYVISDTNPQLLSLYLYKLKKVLQPHQCTIIQKGNMQLVNKNKKPIVHTQKRRKQVAFELLVLVARRQLKLLISCNLVALSDFYKKYNVYKVQS